MNFYANAVKMLREMVDAVNGVFKDWKTPKSVGNISRHRVAVIFHGSNIAYDLRPRPPP